MTVEQLQDTCDAQREELQRLRCDIRATRTREVEVERDVFANEVKRLQKAIKRLQTIQNRISCENRDLGRFKTKCQKLEIVNQRLESCITVSVRANPRTMQYSVFVAPNLTDYLLTGSFFPSCELLSSRLNLSNPRLNLRTSLGP